MAPFPDGFIGNLNASLGQHLLNIAIAQSETEVQPYALLDYFDRKTVTAISALS
jgi:hypothetical protein